VNSRAPYHRLIDYALLIYLPPDAWEQLSNEERETLYEEFWAIRDMPGFIDGAELAPAHTATTVRVGDGQTFVTDGPFADTKEVFGGYYLFQADDLDAAVQIASRIPAARMGGSVEVRPILHR
jgi:hypothetical protein